jgi:hypothetical protein
VTSAPEGSDTLKGTGDRSNRPWAGRAWASPDALDNRSFRLLILTVTGVIAVMAVAVWVQLFSFISSRPGGLGVDYLQYMGHATRWLQTGEFYLPHQLAGPGPVEDGDPLYPPTILWLLVPFTAWPAILWWAFPLATIVVTIVGLRPAPWTWPILAAIALWPRTPALIFYGNPGMWIVMFVCLALRFPWAGPLVLLKPSLAPFALIGFGRRSWFLALALVVAASLPFGALWIDYVTVLRNADLSHSYSLLDLPLLLAPLVAWLGSTRSRRPLAVLPGRS